MKETTEIIDEYLNSLKNTLSKDIEKTSYFNTGLYNQFSEFELLNFFLIDKTIEKTLNLFIKNVEFQDESSFYEPIFKSIALSLFFKNYVEDKTSYDIGDVLIDKDGKTFKLSEKNQKEVKLEEKSNVRSKHGVIEIRKNVEDLRSSYIVINKNEHSDRKLKNSLNEYRNFFKEHFKLDNEYVPSKFVYKAVIVLEKSFKEKLKGKDILKQIPFQWVTKEGTFEKTIIPIEPMIYLLPDYETFKKNIIDKGFNIETVILFGNNKYKNDFTNIQKDLREQKIKNVIIVASEEINEIKENNTFIKWRWTYTEFAKLNNYSLPEISTIPVEEDNFSKSINDYECYLKKLEKDFSIDLKPLFKNINLFSLVFSKSKDLRFKNEIEYKKSLKIKEAKSIIEDKLHNQNIESKDYVNKTIELINKIFLSFKNEKFRLLENKINKKSTLVVPDLKSNELNLKDVKILRYKDFNTKLSSQDYKKDKKIFFLSLFGYGAPNRLIFKLLQTSNKYYFLSYFSESEIIENIKTYNLNNYFKEYYSEDRKKLTGIDFEKFDKSMTKKDFDISDLIEKISLNYSNEKTNYDFGSGEQVNYKITLTFEEENIILDGSKVVILENSGKKEKIKVYNLMIDDNVIIYQNISKNRLFEIATEDNEGRFSQIDNDSKIWKKAFKFYSDNTIVKDSNYLLNKLKEKGSSISSILTLNKWLDPKDSEKFPKSIKDLHALKDLINDHNLNDSFDSILKSRRLFRSIMISLGRDLSNEVIDYIISNKSQKGKILKKFSDREIEAFIKESAPIRRIKSIEITEEEESE